MNVREGKKTRNTIGRGARVSEQDMIEQKSAVSSMGVQIMERSVLYVMIEYNGIAAGIGNIIPYMPCPCQHKNPWL